MIQTYTYSVVTKYKVHNNKCSKMPRNSTLKRVKYSPEKFKEKNKWWGKPRLWVERPNIPHSSADLMQSSLKAHQVHTHSKVSINQKEQTLFFLL